MTILGVSAFYHDSAAAIISDRSGQLDIVAAVQEERFSRKKFDESFPIRSIEFCLQQAKDSFEDIFIVLSAGKVGLDWTH